MRSSPLKFFFLLWDWYYKVDYILMVIKIATKSSLFAKSILGIILFANNSDILNVISLEKIVQILMI